MNVLDSGHIYQLSWLDGAPRDSNGRPPHRISEDMLIFVKREGEGYPGNVGHHPGTNMQEVLRALIDRVKYLDRQVPDTANIEVLKDLRHAIFCLELRAARRHGRMRSFLEQFTLTLEIELAPTCPRCGHVGHVGQPCHGTEGGSR